MDGGLLDMDTTNKTMMVLGFAAGDRVTYVDGNGNEFAALIRHWWGGQACSAAHLSYITSEGSVASVNYIPRGDGSIPGRHWRPEGNQAVDIERSGPVCPPKVPALPKYRPLTPENIEMLNAVRAAFDAVGGVLAMIPYPSGVFPAAPVFPAEVEDALRIVRFHVLEASQWAQQASTQPTSFA